MFGVEEQKAMIGHKLDSIHWPTNKSNNLMKKKSNHSKKSINKIYPIFFFYLY